MSKKTIKVHFSSKKFGQFKKKQYLCTRFAEKRRVIEFLRALNENLGTPTQT